MDVIILGRLLGCKCLNSYTCEVLSLFPGSRSNPSLFSFIHLYACMLVRLYGLKATTTTLGHHDCNAIVGHLSLHHVEKIFNVSKRPLAACQRRRRPPGGVHHKRPAIALHSCEHDKRVMISFQGTA